MTARYPKTEFSQMNEMPPVLQSTINDIVSPDMLGVAVSPDPIRTWKHRLRNQWNQIKGCACAGVVAQGGIHTLCVIFAGVSGVSSSGVSRAISTVFQGNGFVGLTAAETFQYMVAPALSVPLSWGIDVLRKSQYSLSKAGIAIGVSATVAVGIAYKWPHQHEADMAVQWFNYQSQDTQQKIRQFALDTGQTVDEVTLSICGSDPRIQAEMDRLKTPAYQRVYEYFVR